MNNGVNLVRLLAASGTVALYTGSICSTEVVAMMDQEEGVLMYKCPDSGRAVRTSILTNSKMLKRLGAFKLSVWCPHCGASHQIAGNDASVTHSLLAG